MARDEAYREAEKKIAEAARTGATELDLSCEYGADDTEKLTELPESLGQLRQLQTLNLDSNQLTVLPESLGQLTQLQTLNLSDNQLTALPESLGQLTQLQTLDVSRNQLTTLPEWVGELTQLQVLDVSRNELMALPESLSQCILLNHLDIHDCRLNSLPESLGQLRQLKRLWIQQNRLVSLPPSLRQLVLLEWFDVHKNQLDLLPEWAGKLTHLKELHLSYNQLTSLPDSVGQLTQLRVLGLTDNPLIPELAAAYEQGLDAVKAYLRAKTEEQIVLNEAKLILIGEGEVGKSCLLDALRGDPWQEHDSTHGIRLAPVEVTDEDTGTVMTLNGWDFGGQRVYRPTHQLFFSSPAVYLVVWKPREGLKAGQVAEWIKLIKHREPDARVLVVSTHGDDRQPDIDQYQLINEFGSDTVLGFHKIDSRPINFDPDDEATWAGPRTGIDELRTAIAKVAADLPEMGRTVPGKWQRVRERLEESDQSWMHWDDFVCFCTDPEWHGGPRREGNDGDRRSTDDVLEVDQVELFARLSHTLGQLIHYDYDTTLKDVVILKPDWLATAVSFVLDDAETREQHGLVSFERLSHLWNNPEKDERYPEELHPAFRRLMERFDLSYPVIDPTRSLEADTCLIAQLVAESRPDDVPGWGPEPESGDFEQQQVCRILDRRNDSATAEGLFFQLIVRLHKYSLGRADHRQSVHWKYGLMLEDEFNGRALLENVGNDVRITVRAPYPGRFLSILTEHVHSLVESFWEGLRCEITVPCLETCRRENNPLGLLAVRVLIDSKKQGRPEQPCPVCNEWQDIDGLLLNSPVSPSEDAISAASLDDVMAELAVIREELRTHDRRSRNRFSALNNLQRRRISQVDEQFGKLMTSLTDEAKDGPRLFSIQPAEKGFSDRPDWISEKFRLTLWCEHARRPLPSENLNGPDSSQGVYELKLTREWFAKAAPWLRRLGNTLSLVLPILSPAAKVLTDDATYKSFGDELKLGVKCTESFLKASGQAGEWLGQSDIPDLEHGDEIRAHGGALRELHTFLKVEDSTFGGLVRVQNKSGEFFWVHEQFVDEY